MPSRSTPKHPIRIPDELWKAAQAEAERRGESVAEVIRAALERYVNQDNEDP